MVEKYDVVIIGGGPAGIFCGLELKRHKVRFCILEKGMAVEKRDKTCPYDVAAGFAGAGLFSDGKLSYPPSASWLWKNADEELLETSYNAVKEWLETCGVDIRSWDRKWTQEQTYAVNDNNRKEYISDYLSQRSRDMISIKAEVELSDETFIGREAVSLLFDGDFYIIEDQLGNQYKAKKIVYAVGKMSVPDSFWKNRKPDRNFSSEAGVRIEVRSDSFIPSKEETLDYKIIDTSYDGVEIRTFCSCKNGHIIESKCDDFISFNGENDDASSFSNIGIVIRCNDRENDIVNNFQRIIETGSKISVGLSDFMSGTEIYGKKTDDLIREKMENLVENVGDAGGYVVAPEVEKWGYYPVLGGDLIDSYGNFWVGDSTSLFRGLMAAFVSGTYVADEFIRDRDDRFRYYIEKLGINESSTEKLEKVFTAQSKRDFYCRNAVCEYVLNHGYLPVNPFRIFGYFLDDRVSRDIIRRANNQLISDADELWVFGEIANGVLFEIASAIRQHKKIRFFTIATRAEEISELNIDDIKFEPEVHSKRITRKNLIEFIRSDGYTDEPLFRQMDLKDFIDKED